MQPLSSCGACQLAWDPSMLGCHMLGCPMGAPEASAPDLMWPFMRAIT